MNTEDKSTAKTLGLTIGALGIVYGDIGTSVLYALNGLFTGKKPLPVTEGNVLGLISLIFWSLLILISFKYLTLVLRADNKGEGGILSLMTLLTHKNEGKSKKTIYFVMLGLFGAALLYGDGIITPAISVLSAVEGLNILSPSFTQFLVPIVIFILVLLFLLQKRGTGDVGAMFGPVMLVWFSVLIILGVYSIVQNPYVLKALNPMYAVQFFIQNKFIGFASLGAVILTLTGGEALYADMSHFGRKPITVGWFYLVFPALILNYFGQGALLLRSADNPEVVSQLFYHLAPGWALIPLVVLATAATIIASQAIISGAFSMARQSVQLGYIPRLAVVHTSHETIGQVYVPAVNWLLCFGTIVLVLIFRSSNNLAGAYGVAVATTMVITTVLMFFVVRRIWKWNLAGSLVIFGILFVVDFSFFSANLFKIFEGGWISLLIAAGVYVIMNVWIKGREFFNQTINKSAFAVKDFIKDIPVSRPIRVPGTAVFLTGNKAGIPRTLLHNYKHNKILHQSIVLLTVHTVEEPFVDKEDRYTIEAQGEGFYWLNLYFGFSEEPDVPHAMKLIKEKSPDLSIMSVTYFLGRETLVVSKKGKLYWWQKTIFSFLSRNACDASKFFKIPTTRVIEIGIQLEL